jgi:hypothetical protein
MNCIQATFMLIDEKITKWMRCCDLFHSGKFKVDAVPVSFKTTSSVNKRYFMKIINTSFKKFEQNINSVRIAAILWENHLFFHKDVQIISDGEYELFTSSPFIRKKTCS